MRVLIGFMLLGSLACRGEPGTSSATPPPPGEGVGGAVEARVVQAVKQMMTASGGRVTFSTLHNDVSFGPEERAFLGRLYETFFQIPTYLKNNQAAGEPIPSLAEIGTRFQLSRDSVELLLRVMEKDPRMPQLFARDRATGEILRIETEAIDTFVSQRGASVKVNSWEGERLPDFELQLAGGDGSFSRNDLKGSGSLIYFWFSGCPPCVRIAPHLAELDRRFRPAGFQIVGMNADRLLSIPTTDETRSAYLAKIGSTYPNLHLTREAQQAFGNVNVYPTIFISGSDLKIQTHLINYQDLETLESAIREVID